jgi:hypothetical protein
VAARPVTDLVEDDLTLLHSAVVRACALVSLTETGPFEHLAEAIAASRAVARTPAPIRALLTGGHRQGPSAHSAQELQIEALDLIRRAAAVVDAKVPDRAAGYRDAVMACVHEVAVAADGASPREQAAIERVREALGVGRDPSAPR